MRQHDIVLQSLYSGRAVGSSAIYYQDLISQARSDVFFSLVFGGRIMQSAGSFFDSAIAIRIFGELFSYPWFFDACNNYGWRPLLLNTDTPDRPRPIEFIGRRWRNENLDLTLFREFDLNFSLGPTLQKKVAYKTTAAELLERGEYGSFSDHLQHVRHDHVLSAESISEFHTDSESATETTSSEVPPSILDKRTKTYPALLTKDVGLWFDRILKYCSYPNTFNSGHDSINSDALKGFSPMRAIKLRTENLRKTAVGNLRKDELEELNLEFAAKIGVGGVMSPFHQQAPTHYRHYYPLIGQWVESEWHTARHMMYGADACVYSTSWTSKNIFDFDDKPLVSHLSETSVDDSPDIELGSFSEMSWDILFSLVSDSKWRTLIDELHSRHSIDEKKKIASSIIELVVKKMVDYEFISEKSRLIISTNKIAAIAAGTATYTGILAKFHTHIEQFLGPYLGEYSQVAEALPVVAGAISEAKNYVQIAKLTVPSIKHFRRRSVGKRLRKFLVHNPYLPKT